jgi:hypothetical protein
VSDAEVNASEEIPRVSFLFLKTERESEANKN